MKNFDKAKIVENAYSRENRQKDLAKKFNMSIRDVGRTLRLLNTIIK